MRIQHNIASMNAYRNFGTNNSKLSKNLEKLSSGYAVNRAGDDAAGLAVSEKMRAQITGLDAATKNAKDGIGMVQTAEGALTEVHDMLNRMVYLAEQAANGTYTNTDRGNLQKEVDALDAEITRIKSSAKFNGVKLISGSATNFVVDDNGQTITMSAVTFTYTKPTISGGSNTVSAIKSYINSVSTARAKLGATQNRLEHTVNNLGVMRENIQDAESRIRDTDMAEEMMKYTKNNIMNQAAQAMLASANQQPQQVLQLLQ